MKRTTNSTTHPLATLLLLAIPSFLTAGQLPLPPGWDNDWHTIDAGGGWTDDGGRMSGLPPCQPDGQVALPLRRDGQELVPGFALSPGFLNEEVGGTAMEGLDFSIPQEELTFYPNDLVTSGTIRPMPGGSVS